MQAEACPFTKAGAEGRRRGLVNGRDCTCDLSAVQNCCGGNDEHPPECTQDCPTRAASEPPSRPPRV